MKEQIAYKVENIEAKGEIAHYDQFLLLPHCFQKSSIAEASESICMCNKNVNCPVMSSCTNRLGLELCVMFLLLLLFYKIFV